MFPVLIRRGKFNSACGSVSERMTYSSKTRISIALVAAACLLGMAAARARGQQRAGATSQVAGERGCPAKTQIAASLANASALMEQAHYQDAAALLNPLADRNCDARASLLDAAALEALGNLALAEQALVHAHQTWPGNNSIAASLARQYFSAHENEKAAHALEHFRPTPSTPQQELNLAAVVLLATHRLAAAKECAEAAYKSAPSLQSLLLLANVLQLEGRYPNVNQLLAPQRGTYASSPEFFITLAESEYDASLIPDARNDVERALELNRASYQAHYILGNVLARQGETDRAIAEYRAAIELAPGQPRTYYQLALALRSKMDEVGEEQALEKALAADDRYAPAHCEMGRILLDRQRVQEAVAHLTQAVEYNPNSEEAYYLLSRAYAKLGDKEKSEEAVRRLVAVRKANRPAMGGIDQDHPPQPTSP